MSPLAATAQIHYPEGLVPTLVRRRAPKSPAISRKLIVTWGNAMLACLQRDEAELSVLLIDDPGIHELNLSFRQKDRPTDVLSFHFEPGTGASSAQAEWLLGDVVISLDTAARQAAGRKRTLEAEVRWLLAHGVLHLCGYDHATAEEKRVMVNETRKLVRAAQKREDVPIGNPGSVTRRARARAGIESQRRRARSRRRATI